VDEALASRLEGKEVELFFNPPAKDAVNNLRARVKVVRAAGLIVAIEPGMNIERFVGEYFVPMTAVRYVQIVGEDNGSHGGDPDPTQHKVL